MSDSLPPLPFSHSPSQSVIRVGDVPVTVRRVRAARRYTLRVRTAQRDVVLSIPLRGSLASAKAFADRHAAWIAARLAAMATPLSFAEGRIIPLRGVPHVIARQDGRRSTVSAAEGRLTVQGGPAHLSRRLTDWLRRQALADLAEAVARHAGALGVIPGRIRLTDTTSRWGSCSSRGTLAFSWRLILAPPQVLDYVAAHEVAHLREMNHSAAFWAVCDGLFPGRAEAQAWLKVHGAALHRYR